MNDLMARTLDTIKQDQKADEASLPRLESQVKDLEKKIRDRAYIINVLEKALGR